MNATTQIINQQKVGIKLLLQNANNLFSSAELLAIHKYYSPAVSILILSSEELVKSYALCLEILLGDKSEVKKISGTKSKSDDSYLFSHKEKHQLAKVIIADLAKISPFINLIKRLPLGELKKILNFISLPSSELSQVDNLINDLGLFNELKNAGLYVDQKGNSWSTPSEVSESKINQVLNSAKLIRSFFIPKVEYFLTFSNQDLELVYDAINN
jgi:AbiV family abortive infection protein